MNALLPSIGKLQLLLAPGFSGVYEETRNVEPFQRLLAVVAKPLTWLNPQTHLGTRLKPGANEKRQEPS